MLNERCQVTTSLDAKGRLALPAKLRHKLEEQGIDALVLTCDVDGGLKGFTLDYWQEHVEGPMRNRSPFDRSAQPYLYAILADAEDVSVDRQGRMRVPARLRGRAGLERELVFVSIMDWIELWAPQAWEARQSRARHAYDSQQSGNG